MSLQLHPLSENNNSKLFLRTTAEKSAQKVVGFPGMEDV